MPRGAFADVDVSTVDRAVKRAFGGESGRTPFDLASFQVCGTPDATRQTMEAVFAAVAQSFREAEAMERRSASSSAPTSSKPAVRRAS